ncbi:MAG: hypothetical protein IPI52_07375 [Bacteroidetes bacterium]|nr:hypothetical protein [Bacteroidota bacterium]
MASMTLYSNRGQYRLTISTILTHLVVFHEAGFEYSLERKVNLPYVWWNPSTYFGYEWRKSSRPTAPNITEFTFIQGADIKRNPFDFNVSRISEKGYFKSSCIFVSGGISGSDSDGVTGPNTGNFDNLGNDARSINKVKLKFTFDGIERELIHT